MDDHFRRVVEEIEREPFADWSLERTAMKVGYSPFHFHRLFKATTGVTLANFVRSRQMQTAAKHIVREQRLEEVAEMFNYASPGSFSRSFKSYAGVSPTAFRENPFSLVAQERIDAHDSALHMHVRNGDSRMKSKIIELKQPISVIGVQVHTNPPADLNITSAWKGLSDRWTMLTTRGTHPRTFGLEEYTAESADAGGRSRAAGILYTACVEVAENTAVPEGAIKRTIPAGRYAVFTHVGPTETLDQSFRHIYTQGLAAMGIMPQGEFDIEVYDDRFKENSPNSELDIYVPIGAA